MKKPTWLSGLKASDILSWGYAAALMLFMLMTFTYIDIQSNTVWSTYLLDVIVEGRPGDIYQYAIENIYGAPHTVMGGNILCLIPFAIWNIPIWIAQRFFGIKVVECALSMFWAKLFLIFCLIVTLIFANKIMQQMNMDKKQRHTALLLCVTSLMTFTAIGFAGGFDIVAIVVFVMGVYFLMRDKMWLFLLLSGFSVAFRPFSIIAAVAVVLYKQKNILKALLQIGSTLLPLVGITALYRNAPGYYESTTALNDETMYSIIISPTLSVGFAHVSLVVLCLIGLYIYSYFIKVDEDKEKANTQIVYLITAAYGILFLWAHTGFYRGLMLMPFLYILIAKKAAYFKLTVILEMFMHVAWVMRISTFSSYIYAPAHIELSLLPFFNLPTDTLRHPSLYSLWQSETFSGWLPLASPILGAVFFGGLAALLVLLHPKFRAAPQHDLTRCDAWIRVCRMLVPLGVTMVSVALYFFR